MTTLLAGAQRASSIVASAAIAAVRGRCTLLRRNDAATDLLRVAAAVAAFGAVFAGLVVFCAALAFFAAKTAAVGGFVAILGVTDAAQVRLRATFELVATTTWPITWLAHALAK